MRVLSVGVSHRTADVGLLERASVPDAQLGQVLDDLMRCDNVSEAVLISTCNRVEIYAVVSAFREGLADIVEAFPRYASVTKDSIYDHLYVHSAAAAVEHLFNVSSGLDSMTVGEAHVLGQIRAAYGAACQAGAVGRTLHQLIQQALRVGKRVHTETGLACGEPLADAEAVLEAVSAADAILGGVVGRRALVIGAGSMAGLAVAALRRARVDELDTIRGSSGGGLTAAISEADLVICCTGQTGTILDETTVAAALAARRTGRLLVVCDLGVPSDVDPAVTGLAGVRVIDLVGRHSRLPSAQAGLDIHRATAIVAEELRGFLSAQRSAQVTPTVTALHQRAAQVIDTELLRMDARLPELDSTARDELIRTVQRVVDKLLHTPTVRIKELASRPGGIGYADALRELFLLDSQPVTG